MVLHSLGSYSPEHHARLVHVTWVLKSLHGNIQNRDILVIHSTLFGYMVNLKTCLRKIQILRNYEDIVIPSSPETYIGNRERMLSDMQEFCQEHDVPNSVRYHAILCADNFIEMMWTCDYDYWRWVGYTALMLVSKKLEPEVRKRGINDNHIRCMGTYIGHLTKMCNSIASFLPLYLEECLGSVGRKKERSYAWSLCDRAIRKRNLNKFRPSRIARVITFLVSGNMIYEPGSDAILQYLLLH